MRSRCCSKTGRVPAPRNTAAHFPDRDKLEIKCLASILLHVKRLGCQVDPYVISVEPGISFLSSFSVPKAVVLYCSLYLGTWVNFILCALVSLVGSLRRKRILSLSTGIYI